MGIWFIDMELSINYEVIFYRNKILASSNQHKFEQKQPSINDTKEKDKFVDIIDVWNAVDSVFDLGDSNFFRWLRLNEEEQKKFWEIVSKLIKAGILGYRYYEVNGQLERHFIEYEIANPRFANAKVKYIDKQQYSFDWLV